MRLQALAIRFIFFSCLCVISLVFPFLSYSESATAIEVFPGKPKILTSFSLLGDMVRQIGGDDVNIDVLVGADGDCHVYEATPSDAKKVLKADVIFMNGLGFEGWMPRLLEATKTKAKVVEVAKDIEPIYLEKGGTRSMDPHAWHDMKNAYLYGETITKTLADLVPEKKNVFYTRWHAYKERLKAIEERFVQALKFIDEDCKKVVTLHDGFQYLGKAYGIQFMAPYGTTTEAEPSAKEVVRIIKEAIASDIKIVFLENISNPRVMEQIAKESKARLGDTVYSDALSGSDDNASTFEGMMAHNFSVFLDAFGQACQGDLVLLQD